jgi:hypothetical protein
MRTDFDSFISSDGSSNDSNDPTANGTPAGLVAIGSQPAHARETPLATRKAP